MSEKTQPYRYQIEGVRAIDKFGGRALLADDMGLGKTLQSLWYAKHYLDDVPGPIVVICPDVVKHNWEREAWRHVRIQAEVLDGRTPPKWNSGIRPASMYILNYDILGDHKPDKRSWTNYLKKLNPKLVIIDEVQRIKERDSKCTLATKALCKNVPHVIGISGTPIINRPAEFYSILNILRPEHYYSFFAFAHKYCKPEKKPWGWSFNGATNLPQLHKELYERCMIRRLKSDVLDELESIDRVVVPVTLNEQQRAEYNKAEKDFLKWMAVNFGSFKAKRASAAEKLTQMGYLKRLVAELKIPFIINWIDNFLRTDGGKLIVFGIHKKVLQTLCAHYKGICTQIDGSVTGLKRMHAIDAFNNNPRIKLIFCNNQAGGVGWSSTKCSSMLFAELGWTPGEHDQAESRFHGLKRGQEGIRSKVYYLVANKTIEDHLCKTLHKKRTNIATVMDGREDHSMNLFDTLLEMIKANQREVQ